ncbi:MAG TPA: hypothetical protein VJU82_01465 [Acidobacteriaceae bacterium]|nr:hypothetical protein [Acidobacteriaceae bacterium]
MPSNLRQPFAFSSASLLALLALAMPISLLWAQPAEPAPAIVKIDDSKLPIILVEARNVSVPDLLKELSSRFHFAVEGLSGLDSNQKVTVSAKGVLEDILRRVVLPGEGLVAFYRDKTIERIIIVVNPNGGVNTQPLSRQADAQLQAGETREPTTASTRLSSRAGPADAAWVRVAGTQAPAQQGRLNTLLQTQLDLQRQFSGDGVGVPAATTQGPTPASSMAALTLTARVNVLALSSALQAVCIGPKCTR